MEASSKVVINIPTDDGGVFVTHAGECCKTFRGFIIESTNLGSNPSSSHETTGAVAAPVGGGGGGGEGGG